MGGIEKAISYAIRAGGFREAARHYPRAADTFEAAAEVNSARVSRALEQAMGERWRAPPVRIPGQ